MKLLSGLDTHAYKKKSILGLLVVDFRQTLKRERGKYTKGKWHIYTWWTFEKCNSSKC